MRTKMVLIVGRSGSGKDTYAQELQRLGLAGVKSYTTRPRRFETEDTHIFVSREEAACMKDKVAVTHINGYEYFATKSQFKESDFYIVDPAGCFELQKCEDIDFQIVYLYADHLIRFRRAVKRVNKKDAEKEIGIFRERERSENAQFELFEKLIYTMDNVIIHNNNSDDMDKIIEAARADFAKFQYEPVDSEICSA